MTKMTWRMTKNRNTDSELGDGGSTGIMSGL